MRVLSLETATYFGGVGFLAPGVAESAGPFQSRGASKEILAAAAEILERQGCGPGELDVVAVSTGPGLFTGVRVGLSVAKTLAWAGGGKGGPALAPVSTLEAVAGLVLAGAPSVRGGDLVAAVTDARRGEVYTAFFQVFSEPEEPGETTDRWRLRRLTEDLVVRPEKLVESIFSEAKTEGLQENRTWWTGDGADRYREVFQVNFGENGRFYPCREGDLPLRVAQLGREQYVSGKRAAPDEVQPHYVRRPDARPPAI